MWILSYNNGLRDVTRTIYGERFHNMNAWTTSLTRFEHHDTIAFVSYETPIAALTQHVFGDGYTLYVSPYFDCSASTRRQFSRWLRENGLPDYHDVKRFMNNTESGAIGFVDGSGVYVKHSDKWLDELF